MTLPRRAFLQLAAGAAALPAVAPDASAQAYPSRPVTVIVFVPAGGTPDIIARLIGQALSQRLGQSMVVDNRPGGGGNLALQAVARAAPDGYTLFVTTNTTHSANPFLLKTLTYDPVKDFTPIARTGDLPFMLVVNPELPVKSVAELVAYGKANPGKLTYASGSSSSIVSGATFAHNAGIDMLHVPYKSSPPALNDVIGGRISLIFIDVLTGLPHVKGNALRALGRHAEAVAEERTGDGQVCGAQHGVAELAGLDPLGAQYTRCAGTAPLDPAGAVVGGGAHRCLGDPGGDLDGGPHAGRLLDRRDGVRSAGGVDPQPPQPVSDPADVLGVVRSDVQLHQPAHRRVHDPQLTAPVARAEPAIAVRDQPELGVVRGGLRDVRNAHGD